MLPRPAMTPLAEGHLIAGKYRLERPLSQGGMGSVWVARHVDLGMPVAVKLMDPLVAARADGRQRFAREARAAAAIQSPHVVKVHDYGVDGDTPYLVMELLHGEDLGARLRREGRLSLETTARLVLSIAKGLRRAHEAGIVHRDLKPANVFLTRADDDEIVQILDFGIAKLLRAAPDAESERTATGVVMGSIHYMSPEQARGFRDADHRSDVWSLGVIAYRALTGELPFPGEEVGDVIVKVCTDPIPPASPRIRALDPAIGRELDKLFARALAKNPADRFQSARDLAHALCALAGLETEAPTASAPALPASGSPADPDTATRTDAIPALAAPLPLTDPNTASVSATLDTAPPTARPAARRLPWALAAAALTATAILALALSDRSPGPSHPAAAQTTTPAPPESPATSSPSPPATDSPPPRPTSSASPPAPDSASPPATRSPSDAISAPRQPTALPSPSAAVSAPPRAAATSPAPKKPPSAPPPASSEDKVKARFGF
jgi:serine/threonine protein kinase